MFPINKTKKKEHCSNFISNIYDFLGGVGGGRGAYSTLGAYSRWSLNRGRRFLTLLAFRVGAYWRWAFIQGWRLFGVGAY